MEDITPKLLEAVKKTYQAGLKSSKTLAEIEKKTEDEKADYEDGYTYSLEIGRIVSKAFRDNLTAETLPNGVLYYNIAVRVLEPIMKEAYERIADIMTAVQDIINQKAGIKSEAVKPVLDENRLNDFINAVSGQTFEEVEGAERG